MKRRLLLLAMLFHISGLLAQDIKPLTSGRITITTNQKIKFKNLRLVEDRVVFLNTETQSEFTYFLNTVRSIEDENGVVVYLKKETLVPQKKSKPVWIKEIDSLRDKKRLRAVIVFRSGDSLQTHIKVSTNAFDPKLLEELSVNKTIVTVSDGVKVKYSAAEIKSLRFMDFNWNERIFIANGEELVELLFDGKIKWCRMFYTGASGSVSASDFFIVKATKEGVRFNGITRRKSLKEVTKARPDLESFIDEMKLNDENILALLKKY